MSRIQLRNDQGGLTIALLASIMVAGLCTVVVASNITGQRQTRFDQQYEQSLHAAEVGLDRVAHLVGSGDAVAGTVYSSDVADGSYAATAEQGADGWRVSSTGTSPDGTERQVEALLSLSAFFPVAFLADQELQVSGTSSFCLEGQGCGPGGNAPPGLDGLAGTNNRAHFNGYPAMAYGNVLLADWSGNPDDVGRCTFNGPPISCTDTDRFEHVDDRYELPAAERREYIEGLANDCVPLPSGTTLPPGTYCTPALAVGPLSIGGATGDVEIVVTGTGRIELGHAGAPEKRLVNTTGRATRLQIYSLTATEVDIVNNSTIKAMVYAPAADCHSRGNVTYTGALMCRNIDIGGNSQYFAPEDIGRIQYGTPRVRQWQEQ